MVQTFTHGVKAGEAVDVTTGEGHRLREELQTDGASELQLQSFRISPLRRIVLAVQRRHDDRDLEEQMFVLF